MCRENSALLVRHALVCRMSLGSCTCTAQRCRTVLQRSPIRRLSSCGEAAKCDKCFSNCARHSVRMHAAMPKWVSASLHLTGVQAKRPFLQWHRGRRDHALTSSCPQIASSRLTSAAESGTVLLRPDSAALHSSKHSRRALGMLFLSLAQCSRSAKQPMDLTPHNPRLSPGIYRAYWVAAVLQASDLSILSLGMHTWIIAQLNCSRAVLAGLIHLILDPEMRACGALPDAAPQASWQDSCCVVRSAQAPARQAPGALS